MRALVVALVLLVMVPSVRAADQQKELATAHVRKATAEYNLGKYAEAAKEYEAAYEETLDLNLLFNIGQAYRLAGDRDKAIMAYRSFVRSAPQSEQRRLAENKIRELERQRSTAPPPTVPPEPAAPAPAPAATPAAPPAAPLVPPVVPPSTGTPSPASAAATTPSTTETAGGLVTAPVAPEPTRAAPFYKRWPFWTAVGVVVAGGVVLGIVLSRHSKDVTMPASTYGIQEF